MFVSCYALQICVPIDEYLGLASRKRHRYLFRKPRLLQRLIFAIDEILNLLTYIAFDLQELFGELEKFSQVVVLGRKIR